MVEIDRPLVLGRVHGADLVIRDARASRRHVELVPEADGVRLRDLASANGTLVDGEPAAEVLLGGGEEIRIGGVRIAVLATEPAATGAPIAESVRPHARQDTEGPSWSLISRLVEVRTRRGRRLAYAALALAGAVIAAVAVLALTGALAGESEEQRVAGVVRDVGPGDGVRGAAQQRRAQRAGQRLGAGSRRRPGRHRRARGQRGSALLRPLGSRTADAEVVGAAPCEDLAVLRAPGVAAAAALTLGDAAPRGRARRCWRSGSPRPPSPTSRRPPRAAWCPRRARRSATRRPTCRPIPRDPHRHGPRPRVLRRAARRPRRSRGRHQRRRTGHGRDGRPLQGANYAIDGERARP